MIRGEVISKISDGLYEVSINTDRESLAGTKPGSKSIFRQCYCLNAGEEFSSGEFCSVYSHATNPRTGWHVISKGAGGSDYVANPLFQGQWSWLLNEMRLGAVQKYKPLYWFGTIASISEDETTADIRLWSGGNIGGNLPFGRSSWNSVPLEGSILNQYLPGDNVVLSFNKTQAPIVLGFAQKPRKFVRVGKYALTHEAASRGETWVRKKEDINGGPYYKNQSFTEVGFSPDPMIGDYWRATYSIKLNSGLEKEGTTHVGSSFFNPISNILLPGLIILYPGIASNEYYYRDPDFNTTLRYYTKSTGNRFVVTSGLKWIYGFAYEVGTRYSAELFPFENNPGFDPKLYDIIFTRRNIIKSPSPSHFYTSRSARASYVGNIVEKEGK